MNRASLLKSIAETGYNVGFGAKKHFATYDMVQKLPGWIAFLSISIGVFALIYEPLASKYVGAPVVVLGIASYYISQYDRDKDEYNRCGIKLTEIFVQLRTLYREVTSLSDGADVSKFQTELSLIEKEYYTTGITRQIWFSDWYAHFKFFWQQQIDWIDEQKQFKLFRDKLPLSFTVTLILLLLGLIGTGVWFVVARHC